jgi:chromosome segregation ATPase
VCWLLLLVLSSPLYSQSFEPAKSYQVTGAQLNRLETDLQTARNESTTQSRLSEMLKVQLAESQTQLAEALSQLEQLKLQLQQSQTALLEVQRQLQMASASLSRYERQTVVDELIIGSVAAVVAALLVEITNVIIKP